MAARSEALWGYLLLAYKLNKTKKYMEKVLILDLIITQVIMS